MILNQKIKTELLQNEIAKAVWEEISRSNNYSIDWTPSFIEQNAEKLDWYELSRNTSIVWTIEMIEKYQSKINWDNLSYSVFGSSRVISANQNIELLKKFESKWNWKVISRYIQHAEIEIILDCLLDKWDWNELSANREHWNLSTFLKYESYLHLENIDDLKKTAIWDQIVEKHLNLLVSNIQFEKTGIDKHLYGDFFPCYIKNHLTKKIEPKFIEEFYGEEK